MKNYSRCRSTSAGALLALVLFTAGGYLVGKAASFGPEATNSVSQRALTFADRVAYQRAVEEVYWRHRIWPKENPGPKPSLAEVMSQEQMQQKVEEYLRKSQLLSNQWQRPITPEQLQAEMDRMASHTRQPEVLRELFAAMGNDPFIVAECLARPILSKRLVDNLHAGSNQPAETKSPGSLTAKTEKPLVTTDQLDSGYYLPEIANSSVQDPAGGCSDNWTATSITGAPDQRAYHTAVWTGTEMIVWGGANSNGLLNTGGRYSPSTDSWASTTSANAPDRRLMHTAVWTGTEMIVWGGGSNSTFLKTGGRYNPSTDSWIAATTTDAPEPRRVHTAVWTGIEMIIWGGFSDIGDANTGARYNPSTDSWTATSTINAPNARSGHTAVWTGSEMIVWGGGAGLSYFNTGGRYNPSTDSWWVGIGSTKTVRPAPRWGHTAVWTGTEMIVWGGATVTSLMNTGGRYNPITDSWVATNTAGAPTARYYHTASWTGSEMIAWGGSSDRQINGLNSGGRYDPITDSWVATTTTAAPVARFAHTAAWTGTEMIVWGGNGVHFVNTGGRYVPCTGGW